MVEEVKIGVKSFGTLFSQTFEEFLAKFGLIGRSFLFLFFIPIVVLVVIGVLVLIVTFPTISGNAVFNFSTQPTNFIDISSFFGLGPGVVSVFVFIFIVFLVISGIALNLTYINIGFADSSISFSDVLLKTKEHFWKYFGLVIVSGIFITLLFLLFIIPGIIFCVYWIFAAYVLIESQTTILNSLKESRKIVKGRWWKVFGYTFLVGVIGSIVSGVGFLLFIVGVFVSQFIASSFIILFVKNFYLNLKDNPVSVVA